VPPDVPHAVTVHASPVPGPLQSVSVGTGRPRLSPRSGFGVDPDEPLSPRPVTRADTDAVDRANDCRFTVVAWKGTTEAAVELAERAGLIVISASLYRRDDPYR